MPDIAPPAHAPATAPGWDARALVVFGAALGLSSVVGDALLLPQVAEGSPRAMALAAFGLGLAAGGAAVSRWARPGPRLLRWLALSVALGGLLVAWALAPAHAALLSVLAGGSPLPGSLLVTGSTLLVSAPLSLPLGALLAIALTAGGRRALPALAVGLALGVGLSTWLSEVLLGRQGTLLAATAAGTCAAAVFSEAGPLRRALRPLPQGAAAGLAGAAALLTLGHHLGLSRIDLGSLAASVLVAAALVGLGLGALLKPPSRARPVELLAGLGLVLAVGLVPAIRDHAPPGRLADLTTLALLGLPLGLLAGRTLAARDVAGLPGWCLPLALTLPPGLVLILGLPRLGAVGSLSVLALLLLAAHLRGHGPRPTLVGGLLAAACGLALSLVPLPAPSAGLPALEVRYDARGVAALVADPDSGATLLALDGTAPLARSALQQRRLVHLPLVLAPGTQRVLLVADDLGESAAAALVHLRPDLTWLRPFPVPWNTLSDEQRGRLHEAHGNERLHLGLGLAPYDLIVMAPDPRVRRRAPLVGTEGFFRDCAANLTEGGLLCQWWDLSSIDVTDLKSVIGGAVSAFEHVYLALDHPRSRRPCLAILASRRPLRVSPSAIERSLSERPELAADWAAVGLDGVLTACLIQQQTGVARLIAPAERLVTDDRSGLGVRAGLAPLTQPATTLLGARSFSSRRCDPSSWLSVPVSQREAVSARVRDVLRGWQHLVGAAQDELAGSWPDVVPFERLADGDTSVGEAHRLAQALAALPDWPYLLERVVGIAVAWERAGRLDEAEHLLRSAIDECPASPDLRYALARLVERRGQQADACELYSTVLAFDAQHALAQAALARLCGEG